MQAHLQVFGESGNADKARAVLVVRSGAWMVSSVMVIPWRNVVFVSQLYCSRRVGGTEDMVSGAGGGSGAMVIPWRKAMFASQSYCSWRAESGFASLMGRPAPSIDFRAICLTLGGAGVGRVDDSAGRFGAKVRDGRYWMVGG